MKDQARGVLQKLTVGHLVNALVVIAIIVILMALFVGTGSSNRSSTTHFRSQSHHPLYDYSSGRLQQIPNHAPLSQNQKIILIQVSESSDQIEVQIMLLELVPTSNQLRWKDQPSMEF